MSNSTNKEVKTYNTKGLKQDTVQLLSWFSLFSMFLIDKVFHIIIPPLPEYWYGVVFGVAVFGKAVSLFMPKG